MKNVMKLGAHTVEIFAPDDAKAHPVVYLHEGEKESRIWPLLAEPMTLVCIGGLDWDRELSPWPAKGVFGEDFTGGADAYLAELTGVVVPAVEKRLGFVPARRGIAGYSLAGLFAVYAVCKTSVFCRAASVSGSLWFDGFTDYMAACAPPAVPERVYFSVGDRENSQKIPAWPAWRRAPSGRSALCGTSARRRSWNITPAATSLTFQPASPAVWIGPQRNDEKSV